MSQEGEGAVKMPGQTPLSPARGDGVPLVALSDSIVPTLANLTLQQEQQMQQQQQSGIINAESSTTSNQAIIPTINEVSSSSTSQPSSSSSTTHEAASLPAAPTHQANVSPAGPSTTSSLPLADSSSTGITPIKAKDFASMAAAAAVAPTTAAATSLSSSNPAAAISKPADLNATTAGSSSSSTIASNTASNSSPSSTLPSTSATPRTAAPPSSSTTSSSSMSTARPGLPPSSSSSSAIRRPGVGGQGAGLAARIPPSLQAKMAAMASRSNNPTSLQFAQNGQIGAQERIPTSAFLRQSSSSSSSPSTSNTNSPQLVGQSGPGRPNPTGMAGGAVGRVGVAGPMASLKLGATRSASVGPGGVPTVAGVGAAAGGMGGLKLPGAGGGIAKRRGPAAGLNLNAIGTNGTASSDDSTSTPGANGATPGGGGKGINGRAGRPQMKLPPPSSENNSIGGGSNGTGTPFSNFSKIVDPSGSLNFQNKAVLHAKGVDFSTGASFNINMGELELQDELGSGNYGTVQKVYHKVTKVTMAMKEIRLELDDSKLKGIITELDVLHRATAPEIVEFYGAFFIESCVYYCMEYMDAGSLDKMSVIPVPEPVLQRVTASMVRGLKFLKDKLQIMHRDVKPTNVLINTAGMVKLCDFGVSGQLERSLAKTNIGCQSYMAPERIKGESQNFLGTYTVSSDVWSLGLSIIEFTLGRYPYPPETYSNVFAQLTAIVHGDPPCLPDGFSKEADDFVAACLQKDAHKRPSYAQLLRHPFLATEAEQDTDMIGWVKAAMEKRASMKNPGSSSAPTVPVKNT